MRFIPAALIGLWATGSLHAASLPVSLTLASAETPGPSAALFANPPYQCVSNVYVASTGSDTAAGTAAAPWATLQRADASAVPGMCVNVQPGTYPAGVLLTHGGNAATSTGYVVYRCAALLACKITANGGYGAPAFAIDASGQGPNYVMIDGFEMAAQAPVTYGVGVILNNNMGAPKPVLSAHHIWILNNRIHGFGQGGVGTNEADWLFVLHNEVYNTAGVTCDAQGSGISLVVAKALANYVPTPMDNKWAPFHQVIAWNVTHNNIITGCGSASSPYDTDGNGIIIDTFNGAGVDNVLYPNQTLVAFNVSYQNGARGIQVFRSSFATIANNTTYDNNLDPYKNGDDGEVNLAAAQSTLVVNNIVYPVPAKTSSDPRCAGVSYANSPAGTCPLMNNSAISAGGSNAPTGNVFKGNVTYGGTPPYGWGPKGNQMNDGDVNSFSCTPATGNKCNVNPLFSNVSTFNFALTAGSPAIGFGQVTAPLPTSAVDAGSCYRSATKCP